MLREVFWALDVNKQKILVALETDKENLMIQHIYMLRPDDFTGQDEFHHLKNQIFDTWRNFGEMDFPKATVKKTWNVEKSATYPEDLPTPDPEDKKDSLARKIAKNVWQDFSQKYKEEVKTGILGFQQKVNNATEYKPEDRNFIDTFDKLIRTAQDNFADNETQKKWESECLTGADARELREILRGIREKLDVLKSDLWEGNFHDLSEKLRELREKNTDTADLKSLREAAFSLKNEIISAELSRDNKDGLMTSIKDFINQINDLQNSERKDYEATCEKNYQHFGQALSEVEPKVEEVETFQPVREMLKKIQVEMRDAKLLREQRNELYERLDKAFKRLAERQENEKKQFGEESIHNYETLAERLETGKKLAQFNDDFQETRELLKQIQQDVNQSKLSREQREELRTGLNTAFETLNKRADRYYADRKLAYEKRQKEMDTLRVKKRQEWEFRMKEKIVRLEGMIKNVEKQMESDKSFLLTLEERWEDTGEQKYKESIQRVNKQIEERQIQIDNFGKEIAEFEAKLANKDESGN